jgi:hypothetical protein
METFYWDFLEDFSRKDRRATAAGRRADGRGLKPEE